MKRIIVLPRLIKSSAVKYFNVTHFFSVASPRRNLVCLLSRNQAVFTCRLLKLGCKPFVATCALVKYVRCLVDSALEQFCGGDTEMTMRAAATRLRRVMEQAKPPLRESYYLTLAAKRLMVEGRGGVEPMTATLHVGPPALHINGLQRKATANQLDG